MISIIVTCRQKYFSNLVFFSLESNTVVLKYDLPVIFHLYFLIPFYRSIILFSSSTFVTSICCYLLLIKKKTRLCGAHVATHTGILPMHSCRSLHCTSAWAHWKPHCLKSRKESTSACGQQEVKNLRSHLNFWAFIHINF